MNDEFEARLRKAFASDAAQPIGVPGPESFLAAASSPKESDKRWHGRRLTVAAAAAVAILIGGGVVIANRGDDVQRVQVGDVGEPVALPAPGEVLEIPPPFEGFDAYNYVTVKGGNSILVLGAATNTTPWSSSELRFDDTSRSARLDLGTGMWTELPALPVQEGLQSASAVELDGRLYVLGADCEATDTGSWHGVSFHCYDQSPMLLRLAPDAESWEVLAAPRSGSIEYGAVILSTAPGRLVFVESSQHYVGLLRREGTPPVRFDEYDPTTNTWVTSPDAPFSGGLCVIDGHVYAGATEAGRLELVRWDEGRWVPEASPFGDANLHMVDCADNGLVGFTVSTEDGPVGSLIRSGPGLWSTVSGDRQVPVDSAVLYVNNQWETGRQPLVSNWNAQLVVTRPWYEPGPKTVMSDGVEYALPSEHSRPAESGSFGLNDRVGDYFVLTGTDGVKGTNRTVSHLYLWRVPS